jgi:hypothetical protein
VSMALLLGIRPPDARPTWLDDDERPCKISVLQFFECAHDLPVYGIVREMVRETHNHDSSMSPGSEAHHAGEVTIRRDER